MSEGATTSSTSKKAEDRK
ncbi:hypothetical protein TIFTF001_052143 [Ficus carica]|uniref:Uncharacterized protein n=1 Tax=Ficus carica TaxID=3494 RepID=A0AA88JI20_FICCA|nr:hypothetical protein TIFTF001_052143 [Ficus carica]